MTQPSPIPPRTYEPPQPITPADACRAGGDALLAAADQLHDLLADLPDYVALPGDPYEVRIPPAALHAIVRWLDARAGLYGSTR